MSDRLTPEQLERAAVMLDIEIERRRAHDMLYSKGTDQINGLTRCGKCGEVKEGCMLLFGSVVCRDCNGLLKAASL